jgi:hypothetical protein
MNRKPREEDFVYRHLQDRRIRLIVNGYLLAIVGLGVGVFAALDIGLTTPPEIYRVAKLALVFLPGALGLVLAVGRFVESLLPFAWQRAGTALRRYGEPCQILAAVNSEMVGPADVLEIGERVRTVRLSGTRPGSTYAPEVYLTPSWIVCFSGILWDRLTVFRVADVILAARIGTPLAYLLFTPLFTHTWITLLDCHGVRVRLPLPRASATRLLAEVLARVPWTANHFDPAATPEADADLARFMAEVNRRREELRVTGQTPPTSPS